MGSETKAEGEHDLDRAAVEQFHEKGYLGPFELCSPDEMAEIRADLEDGILAPNDDGVIDGEAFREPHLSSSTVYDLSTDLTVLDRMESLLGPDLLLWSSTLFYKEPQGPEFPWHQDVRYWDIEPPVNVSFWLAIDEVTTENGCMQIIPGSHQNLVRHVEDESGGQFKYVADPDAVDESEAVDVELEPGEFILFNERTLHRSHENDTDGRRLGLSARVTVPFVQVGDKEPMVVRGEDWHGLNELGDPEW